MTSSIVQLKTLAELQAGMPTTSRDVVEDVVDLPLITVRAICGGQIERDAVQGISDAGTEGAQRYRVEANDLLIPSRSTSMQAALVPSDLAGAVFNATLIRIRCVSDRLAPALLKAYLDHPEGRAMVEAVSQSGTHQMNITVSALGEIEVPLPSFDHQAVLVATLQSAELVYASGIEAAQRRRALAQDIIIRKMRGEEQRRVGASL